MPAVTVSGAGRWRRSLDAGGQVAKAAGWACWAMPAFWTRPSTRPATPARTIEDQQARSLSDLLVNDPSVRLSSARTNINEDFSIRGFTVASQDVAFNGMYGLMPYYRVPVEIAERVDVLEAPRRCSTACRPAASGRRDQHRAQRAGADPLTSFTASYLLDSTLGGHVDIGRRFGE